MVISKFEHLGLSKNKVSNLEGGKGQNLDILIVKIANMGERSVKNFGDNVNIFCVIYKLLLPRAW